MATKARPQRDTESGYRPCACRDCFEIAIGRRGAMCNECEAAGCESNDECQAPHAYDQHCGDTECCGPVPTTAERIDG